MFTLLKKTACPHTYRKTASFNMTPIIDIVFLLIIFFLMVSQLIEAENFDVNVPDNCQFSQLLGADSRQVTTVTVMNSKDADGEFAVGSEKIAALAGNDLIDRLCGLINTCLETLPAEDRIVTLRIDRDVPFAKAQFALAAVARSNAVSIKLAALKDKHHNYD